MGDLKDRAVGRDPSVTNGQLKTTFRRVKGDKKLDRAIARKHMKDAGYVHICKGDKSGRNKKGNERKSDSIFALNWEKFSD